MKEELERELKLSVAPGFVLPPLAVDVERRDLRATYHDTPDHRLARRGVTLRRRSEDGHDFWQLKLPAATVSRWHGTRADPRCRTSSHGS